MIPNKNRPQKEHLKNLKEHESSAYDNFLFT